MNKFSSIEDYEYRRRIKEPLVKMEEIFSNEDHEYNFIYETNQININEIKQIEESSNEIENLSKKIFYFSDENSSKKDKKYKMHSVEVKKKCLELVIYLFYLIYYFFLIIF